MSSCSESRQCSKETSEVGATAHRGDGAATAQQLYCAKEDEYAGSAEDLEDYGFRQGGQTVVVKTASGTAYCMQAPGGQRSVQDFREYG